MSSANLTELLIKKIKHHRILYDSRSPDYKNIRKKDKIWETLGRELRISGDILKNKWRNLRDTYGKHLKSVSPYAGPNVKKSYKHWQWATHMEYFKPYLSYSYITTNEPEIIDIDNDTSSNVFGASNDFNESLAPTFDSQEQERHCYGQLQSVSSVIEQEIDFLPIVCKPKKQRQQEDRYKLLDVQPMEDTLFQRYNENVHRSLELDATELIFLGYAKTIKTFSPRRQARMKVKLAQIITEEEEEDEEDVHQLQELALSSMSGPSSSDLIIPGGSPSSPGSVPIAPKKLSSVVPLSSTLPTTLPTASPSSSSVPPPPPEVCLRWNSYYSNMQATFPTLLNNEQFVDVTLACEGRSIKCHKVMLSACSSYFEELLSQNPCQHPIVFMRDLKFWEVQALVEFMYSGEVNVAQEKLPSLLAAAEALQIKGLTGPSQSSQQDESDYMPIQDSDEVPMSQSHKRVRKRKSTNPMAYPSRQPPQPPQSAKQMPMMHPIVQHSTSPSLSSTGGASSSGIAAQLPTSSPNRKESTSSSYHPPVKIKKERESTPPLALIKEEPLDLGKDSMETGSNNGHDLSNASSSYQASNYDRSHYSGRSLGKPQNGLSDEEDQDRLSTHSNQSDDAASLVEQKHDPGDDVSDA
ncbi:uncharacterized protein isoform X2 [Rhodnius prolixus]|uniref:uncharacterized protein isoform X2 n=1 Tax=Rhodnius prolixus TaxID=13249 RepID=UPI003D18B49B